MSELERLSTLSEIGIQKRGPENGSSSVNGSVDSGIEHAQTITHEAAKYYTMMQSIPSGNINPELSNIDQDSGSISSSNGLLDADTNTNNNNNNNNNNMFTSKGDGKFLCQVCDNVFSRKQNLKAHLVTHTGKKPYICNDCGSTFRRPYDLRRHERIHSKEKPFTCPHCGKSFPRKDALNRHCKMGAVCGLRKSSEPTNMLDIYSAKNQHKYQNDVMKIKKTKPSQSSHIAFRDDELLVNNTTNAENNFFVQQNVQEPGKVSETESNLRKLPEYNNLNSVLDATNLGSRLGVDNTTNSPLTSSMISGILADIVSNGTQIRDFLNQNGSDVSPIQLNEEQFELLKLILSKLQNLDDRVTKIEHLLQGKFEYLNN